MAAIDQAALNLILLGFMMISFCLSVTYSSGTPALCATMPPAGHTGRPTRLLQALNQCDGQRGLAGTAGHQVTHHHHRRRHAALAQQSDAECATTQGRGRGVHRLQHTRRQWGRAAVVPPRRCLVPPRLTHAVVSPAPAWPPSRNCMRYRCAYNPPCASSAPWVPCSTKRP